MTEPPSAPPGRRRAKRRGRPRGVLGGRRAAAGRSSLGGSLGWFAGSYGIAILGYLALFAIASRFLGRDEFGYFVVILTVTTIVGELALLGVHRAGLREVARTGDAGTADLGLLRMRVRAACWVNLPVVGLGGAVITWAVSSGLEAADRAALSASVAALIVLSGHQKLWGNFLRGFGMLRLAGLLEGRSGGALVAVLQSALLALAWVFAPTSGLVTAFAAVSVGYLVPILVAYWRVNRRWRTVAVPSLTLRGIRSVFGRDWRFASGQLGSYLNANLELWVAGLLLTAVDTSLFGAAQRLSLLVVAPLTSLQVVFSPAIARMSTSGTVKELQALVRTGATVAAVPMLVVCVPLVFFPSQTLSLVFGSGYAPAATALLLITVGSVVNVLTGLCGATLTMTDHEGTVATVQWAGVVLRTGLAVLAGVVYGLDALAASAGLTTAAIWIVLWYAALLLVGVRSDPTPRPRLRLLRSTVG